LSCQGPILGQKLKPQRRIQMIVFSIEEQLKA
jgi:hypothetical protein